MLIVNYKKDREITSKEVKVRLSKQNMYIVFIKDIIYGMLVEMS